MRTTLVFVLLASPAFADGSLKLEYLDFLGAEVVGELKPRKYDLHLDDKFVAPTAVPRDTLVGGGFGLRLVMREISGKSNGGVRFGFEAAGTWGRFQQLAYGTVSRAELLASIGYEGTLGILVLHTSTVLGFDYQSFDVGKDASMSMLALRAGQQVGAHLQLGGVFALYADGTLDWDGQWRVRAGISVGELIRKPRPEPPVRSSPASKAVLAPNVP